MQTDAIWVFDSQCVLCSRGVQFTLRHEKRASIRFVAIRSDEGRALARQHGIDPENPVSFLFIENGKALEKSDAIIALSQHLNGPVQVLRYFSGMPLGLRDAVYTVIARHRYRIFGKRDQCLVPDPDQQHRFVLP